MFFIRRITESWIHNIGPLNLFLNIWLKTILDRKEGVKTNLIMKSGKRMRETREIRKKYEFEIFTQFKLNNKANIRVTILAFH